MKMNSSGDPAGLSGGKKRPWSCPKLKVYGKIEESTQQKPFGSGDTTSLGGPS